MTTSVNPQVGCITRLCIGGLVDAYCTLWQQGSRYERLLQLPSNRPITAASVCERRRATKTAPADADAIVEAYRRGESVRQLALRFNMHRGTVHNLLETAGVPRQPRGLSERETEEAVRMYADGLLIAKIARRFSLAPSGIDRLLKRRGVVLRDRHWRKPKGVARAENKLPHSFASASFSSGAIEWASQGAVAMPLFTYYPEKGNLIAVNHFGTLFLDGRRRFN